MWRFAVAAGLLAMGPAQAQRADVAQGGQAVAVFAGGCFWCVEADFDKLPGVISTTSGYTGGRVPNPTYEQVSYERTGHYEAVRIVYDPKRVSYVRLLDHFWRNIDPTDAAGQFCDKGESYRSAIFYLSDEQKRVADDTIKDATASGLWPGKIVTEIEAAREFWEAEPEHQDYLERSPNGYNCHYVRCEWKLPC